MARVGVVAIRERFAKLTDPRVDRTKDHLLSDMVVIALCAAICGANSWADVERFGNSKLDWLLRFLDLPNGIPSHDTFGRVFSRLDTSEFLTCLHNWLRSLGLALKEKHVAIDGKTLRRSFDKAEGKSALHLVMLGRATCGFHWAKWPWTTNRTRSRPSRNCSRSWS